MKTTKEEFKLHFDGKNPVAIYSFSNNIGIVIYEIVNTPDGDIVYYMNHLGEPSKTNICCDVRDDEDIWYFNYFRHKICLNDCIRIQY